WDISGQKSLVGRTILKRFRFDAGGTPMATVSVETPAGTQAPDYAARLAALRAEKMAQTQEKWAVIGSMDYDDWALILPPPEAREVIRTVSASGVPIVDVKMKGFAPESNHPS